MDLVERLVISLGSHFSVEGELGGGRSRVFVATERALGRRIVVKVIAPEIAAELDAARFRREIALIARLQHPHIVPLLAAGEADGLLYYTMPYVGTESLRTRLEGGELPIADATRLLRDVAAALAYAHRQGVVHRDIKPENILLSDGAAMVIDFGIAKAVDAARTPWAAELTRSGTSLGTPAYTAPEQAAADPGTDHRADLYALGVIGYEMLTGRPPFEGRTAQALFAAHATLIPEHVTARRSTVPLGLAALVMRCLEKRPADRPQSAEEVRRALQAVGGEGPPALPLPSAAAGSAGRWALAGVGAIALVVGVAAGAWLSRAAPAHPAVAAMLVLEPGSSGSARGTMALSHDGSQLAFTADENPADPLRIRPLSGLAATAIAGTERARHPFWSPDDRFIGFDAGGHLKTVELATGTVRTICPVPPQGVQGAWSGGGTIVVVPILGREVYRADGAGCEPIPLRDSADARYSTPSFLPDQRHFLLSDRRSGMAVVAELETGAVRFLRRAEEARFVPPDRLLFIDRDTLFVQALDPATLALEGEPRPLLPDVVAAAEAPSFTASPAGILVADAFEGAAGFTRMLLVDRREGGADTIPDLGVVKARRFSRDGRRIALGGAGLWVYHRREGAVRKVPAEDVERTVGPPLWSPADSLLAYATDGAHPTLRVFRLRDSTSQRLYQTVGRVLRPSDWSPDGRHIAFTLLPTDSAPHAEVWVYSMTERSARPLLAGGGADYRRARFAPDGRWIAYQADSGGASDVYVMPFPGPGPPVRVSVGGGAAPMWRADGAELVYLRPGGPLLAAPIRLGPQVRLGQPVTLPLSLPENAAGEDPAIDLSPDARWAALSIPRALRRTILVNWGAPAER